MVPLLFLKPAKVEIPKEDLEAGGFQRFQRVVEGESLEMGFFMALKW